jgi:Divergent InlB B-repeat domain/PEGA domain
MKNTFRKYSLLTVSILTLLLITCVENHVLPGLGSIFINSDPEGAEVFLNGELKGETPLSLEEILSGEYNISLSMGEFEDSSFSVQVSENQELDYEIFLSEENPVGKLILTSVPEGALIFLNGINTQQVTPDTLSNLVRGQYKFVLKLDLYDESSFNINLAKDETIEKNTRMIIAGSAGGLLVSSTPSGAAIFLDDFNTGKITPDTLQPLAPGDYSIKLSLEDYRDTNIVSNVSAGLTNTANVVMTFYEARGSITLDSNPQGAGIFLENVDTELFTPNTLSKLEAGNYIIRLELNQYNDTTFTVNVIKDQNTKWTLIEMLEIPFIINVTIDPEDGGTVSGGGGYNSSEQVILIASANSGYTFINWTEDDSTVSSNATYQFTAERNRNLIANFSLNSYVIETSSNPANGGTTSGGGGFDFGNVANLTATPEVGYTFINWTENENVVSTEQNYSFTVNSSRSLVANFSLNNYVITTTSDPANGGSTSGGGGFDFGDVANLTAAPEIGYTFINWTENENVVSTEQNYSFTVNISRTLVANFSLNSYTITTNSNPSIGGSTSGGGIYNHGDLVELTANPSSGYSFVNWTEDESEVSTSVSYQFTALSNTSLVANFIQNGILIINSDPQGADIYIDDAFTGEQTPGIIEDLLGGQYSVTLKLEDFADTTLSMDIISGETTDLGTIFLRDITPSVVAYISYEVEPFTQRLNFIFSFNQDVRFTRVDVTPPQGPNFQWPFNNQLIPEGIETSFGVPEKIVGDWTFTCFGRKVDGRQTEFEYTDVITVE